MDDKQTISDLRKRIESLETSAAMGFLISGIVHEVNNPLSVLLIGGDTLRRNELSADPTVQKLLDTLEIQSERIIAMSRLLQEMNRANLAHRAVVDMRDLLAVFERLEAVLEGGESRVQLSLGEDPLLVSVDPQQITQICRYLAMAMRVRCPRGNVVVTAAQEEIPLITFGPAAARSPKRSYIVTCFRIGEPDGAVVPFTKLMADFFGSPREPWEVQLMACWEIVRKLPGKLTIVDGTPDTLEIRLLIPLPPREED